MGGGFRLPVDPVVPRLILNPFYSESSMSKVKDVVRFGPVSAIGYLVVQARRDANLPEEATKDAEFKLSMHKEHPITRARKRHGCYVIFNKAQSVPDAETSLGVFIDADEMDRILTAAAREHLANTPQEVYAVEYEIKDECLLSVTVSFPRDVDDS
jgi:hypothetical protein